MRLRIVTFASAVSALLSATTALRPALADDVVAAAQAFEEGQRAQLRREYARAAELFEIADRLAPNAAALRSAIRNHQAAGHQAAAATLALRVKDRYPGDAQTIEIADGVIAEAAGKLARVDVTCSIPCALTVDRLALLPGATPAHAFFADPGSIELEATWPDRPPVSRKLDLVAGQKLEVALTAPEAPPPPVAAEPADRGESLSLSGKSAPPRGQGELPRAAPGLVAHDASHGRKPIAPVVFWIGAAATGAATGVWAWSGIDTLSARDKYVEDPTKEGFDDGVSRERRTNVLGVTAIVLGAGTALLGLLATDWGGDDLPSSAGDEVDGPAVSDALWPSLSVEPSGWRVGIGRSF